MQSCVLLKKNIYTPLYLRPSDIQNLQMTLNLRQLQYIIVLPKNKTIWFINMFRMSEKKTFERLFLMNNQGP